MIGEDKLDAYIESQLDDEEREAVEERLASDEELQDVLADQVFVHRALSARLAPSSENRAVVRSVMGELNAAQRKKVVRIAAKDGVSRRARAMRGKGTRRHNTPSLFWRAALAVAACLLVVFGLYRNWNVVPGTGRIVAYLDASEGDVRIHREGRPVTARPRTAIRSGDIVETAGGSLGNPGRVTVAYENESTFVRMDPGTRVQFAEANGTKRVKLHTGRLVADVARQSHGSSMVFLTSRARATVIGTRLDFAETERHSLLKVREGMVQIQDLKNGKTANVSAGHYGVVSSDGLESGRTQIVKERIAFQDGVFPSEDYNGTTDALIAQSQPDANFGEDETLIVDGKDAKGFAKSSLVRWGIFDIPADSKVSTATVELFIVDPMKKKYPAFQIHAIPQSWHENEVSWSSSKSSQRWQEPGLRGRGEDAGAVLGTVSALGTGLRSIALNASGVSQVQEWVETPEANHGFLFAGDLAAIDGFNFLSCEVADHAKRPKLIIEYTHEIP